MRNVGFLPVMVACCLAVSPALACDNGPWPVTFQRNRASLTQEGEGNLLSMIEMRRIIGRGTIRFVLYNPDTSAPALWRRRVQAVRFRTAQVARANIPIEVIPVPTKNGMVGRYWRGRATNLSVEIVQGCHG